MIEIGAAIVRLRARLRRRQEDWLVRRLQRLAVYSQL
jgi:hypothetical protein